MGTLSGEATLPFHFCLPSQQGQGSTSKSKNLIAKEHLFSFKNKKKILKCVPIAKLEENNNNNNNKKNKKKTKTKTTKKQTHTHMA